MNEKIFANDMSDKGVKFQKYIKNSYQYKFKNGAKDLNRVDDVER